MKLDKRTKQKIFVKKIGKKTCNSEEAVIKYITVRRTSDTNASEKWLRKSAKQDDFFQKKSKNFKKVLDKKSLL